MSAPSTAPNASAFLAHRARSAIALTIGFYVLALTVAGVLLWIPWAEARYSDSHQPQFLILWLAAGAILWSILPRREHFEAPGALLAANEHPDLFRVVGRVAEATGQPMPTEIYLVREVNAWVGARGGIMGVGSRRIMGLGLPLLQELTVSQLQAVLAHEFGHYTAGDVKLGPFIHQTRAAIGRTVAALAESGAAIIYIVHKPFVWYGEFFLRFTHAISRGQELQADAVSVRLVGPDALATALSSIHEGAEAFARYWRGLAAPVLRAGFRPPLAAGYRLFRSSPSATQRLEAFMSDEPERGKSDPYDTHPTLGERVAHIRAVGEAPHRLPPALPEDARLAIELLGDVDRAEAQLLYAIAPDRASGLALKPIDWSSVGERVFLERFRRLVMEVSAVLDGMTESSAPTDKAALEALARRLLGPRLLGAGRADLAELSAGVVAAATVCNLVSAGWTIEAMPGQPFTLRRGDVELRPFAVMRGLVRGEKGPSDWSELCSAGGISDVPLAPGNAATRSGPATASERSASMLGQTQ
jgi:Zn-dependent protease with chaperone function